MCIHVLFNGIMVKDHELTDMVRVYGLSQHDLVHGFYRVVHGL